MPASVVVVCCVGKKRREGVDRGHRRPARADDGMGHILVVIRPLARRDRLEGDLVGTDIDHIAGVNGNDALDAPAGRRKPEQGHAETGMGEGGAPGRSRQSRGTPQAPSRA